MALNQTNKLVWIVETIRKARRISFGELNRKWKENEDLSGGLDLQKRTFHKWKRIIKDTFGLTIGCEKTAPYRYYIENEEDVKNGSIEHWLLSTCSVSNSLADSRSVKDRILIEEVPSGREYLEPVIEAMKTNRFVHITYYSYWRSDFLQHYLMPLCVKLFRQRWYMVGRSWPSGEDAIYCLDRVKEFRLSSHTFAYPEDFDPEVFFEGCFGIIAGRDFPAEDVLLKVSSSQANYLRALPLHSSQKEVEEMNGGECCYFRLHVRPTYDFQQELLWNREELEVLEPAWLRKEMKSIVSRMAEKYRGGRK